MPRMAQPGTTTNLRRLAGRRSPVGAPHIPLESTELPPVLFRLPEVHVESNSQSDPVMSETADGGQNVFNHVAGAVTGAVAGTVANSVAVAGSLAGSALAATPFGSSPVARPSFQSVASTLSPQTSPAPSPAAVGLASAKAIPVPRPIPEAVDTDKRSWWEHWSSGIILMLLILALVTAGIMAIRDPERTRATPRSIADENKQNELLKSSTAAEVKVEKQTEKAFDFEASFADEKRTGNEQAKPALAETGASGSATPAASASLSPTLLPDANSSSGDASARVPSFTLGSNNRNTTEVAGPALVANNSGFMSSSQPSPGSAASEGSASRLATSPGNVGGSSTTPAISASTQLGSPQPDGFEANIPANPASTNSSSNSAAPNLTAPNLTAPNLTWPVDESSNSGPKLDQQSANANPGEANLASSPEVTAPELLTAATTSGSAESTSVEPASTEVAPVAATRPAYLETSLPNEDLESILALRRQALANSRVVSNQYYVAPAQPANEQNAAGQVAGWQGINTQPAAAQVPPSNSMQNYYPQNQYPQGYYPPNPNPVSPQAQPQVYPAATYPNTYPVQPNMMQPNMMQPNTSQGSSVSAPMGYPVTGSGSANSYPSNTTTSQAIGTRSWTYSPNANATPSSWTLAAPTANPTGLNPASAMPTQSSAMPAGQGLQMDPNYARQLGYGQPASSNLNANAPNISAPGGYSSGLVR